MKVLRILLAEDCQGDIQLVRESLTEHRIQHELYVVQDGEAALQLVARMGEPGEVPCPDVMLLDLNLPKGDGPQILTEFRKHPLGGATPVIVVTSSDAPKDRERMSELGISYYFRKPMDFTEFMRLGEIVKTVTAASVETEPARDT